jgi:hypothetical protein
MGLWRQVGCQARCSVRVHAHTHTFAQEIEMLGQWHVKSVTVAVQIPPSSLSVMVSRGRAQSPPRSSCRFNYLDSLSLSLSLSLSFSLSLSLLSLASLLSLFIGSLSLSLFLSLSLCLFSLLSLVSLSLALPPLSLLNGRLEKKRLHTGGQDNITPMLTGAPNKVRGTTA